MKKLTILFICVSAFFACEQPEVQPQPEPNPIDSADLQPINFILGEWTNYKVESYNPEGELAFNQEKDVSYVFETDSVTIANDGIIYTWAIEYVEDFSSITIMYEGDATAKYDIIKIEDDHYRFFQTNHPEDWQNILYLRK